MITREVGQPDGYILLDIDDTLFDTTMREHLLPDWDAFHAECDKDLPIDEMLDIVHSLKSGEKWWEIYAITGRTEKYRTKTMQKLIKHGVEVDALFMRSDSDFRPASVIKIEVINNILSGEHGIGKSIIFIDDNEKNCEAVRALGITTLHITTARRRQ